MAMRVFLAALLLVSAVGSHDEVGAAEDSSAVGVATEATNTHFSHNRHHDLTYDQPPVFVAVFGPTGSGKSSTEKWIVKHRNLTNPHMVIIDDLVEKDDGYKQAVKDALDQAMQESQPIRTSPAHATPEVRDLFTNAYYTARKGGCGGIGCDTVNDEEFFEALGKGQDVIFESTGADRESLAWPVREIRERGVVEYKIILTYNIVNFMDLKERIFGRTVHQISNFIDSDYTSLAPRLPDFEDLASIVDETIETARSFIDCLKDCLFDELYLIDNTGPPGATMKMFQLTADNADEMKNLLALMSPQAEELAKSVAHVNAKRDARSAA